MGRYLESDPIGLDGVSFSTYAYVQTIGQRQKALQRAINRVKLHYSSLPAKMAEWEAIATQVIPIMH